MNDYKALIPAWFSDPVCLTWSEPAGLEDVARAFGADLAAAELMSVEDAQIEQYNADIPGVLPILVAGTIGTGRWLSNRTGARAPGPKC
ncbi:hypothetical protein GCM10010116_13530 [Microbispora rosea subsp. aerata]|nr:hypothetical protein [Microbispora rosea]GGO06798.1 hypothetical protein GCM10010116_13530 [Microbispora rosea subsp. aerata]GIH55040.1 hypothetical protein Mro02_19540 [Microbispora rosea subsp. aerata]GLJ82489.1 hypothetical protein GCM10017588_12140 [Microbispora rosea subsp. aerata]